MTYWIWRSEVIDCLFEYRPRLFNRSFLPTLKKVILGEQIPMKYVKTSANLFFEMWQEMPSWPNGQGVGFLSRRLMTTYY